MIFNWNPLPMVFYLTGRPTGPSTILEPEDQEIGEFYAAQERRATDFKASKL